MLTTTPTDQLVSNHQLLVMLVVLAIAGLVGMVALTATCISMVNRANREMMQRFESLREDALRNYIEMQREENARLVADTRAATAKMNVMADALWEGLKDTARDL